jgi:hypothetical protein
MSNDVLVENDSPQTAQSAIKFNKKYKNKQKVYLNYDSKSRDRKFLGTITNVEGSSESRPGPHSVKGQKSVEFVLDGPEIVLVESDD